MRVLDFVVDRQKISADPKCDFTGLTPGTKGYIYARFKFSDEWRGCKKVAQFSSGGIEYTPQVLDGSSKCLIPSEVLERYKFDIRLYGGRGDNYLITTDTVTVTQKGGLQ